MKRAGRIPPLLYLGLPLCLIPRDAVSEDLPFRAPLKSRADLQVRHLSIPAPRGLVLDREGEALIQNRAARYLAVRPAAYRALGNAGAAYEAISSRITSISELPAIDLSRADFERHWQHRPELPFPLTKPLGEEEAARLEALIADRVGFTLETVFVREYPAGPAAAHLTGHVRGTMPFQHGPLADPENRWPLSEGAAGLEKSLETELAGTPGLVSQVFDARANLVEEKRIEPAVAGLTVVTTVHRPMQELAHALLAKSGRPGALVAMDALTGDILAMVSYPSFDPNAFVGGLPASEYERLERDEDAPLFPKAELGVYPPGSTFKPIVALAALDCGAVRGTLTRFASPPALQIQGRTFRNWSGEDEGHLDVRYALVRSSNTWFYQAGLHTGGDRLLAAARSFGFGQAPALPVPTAAGSLPRARDLSAAQAIANFSIGQGEFLVSPLQLTIAMCGLSAGTALPQACLIQQLQHPVSHEVVRHFPRETLHHFNTRPGDRDTVRAGMWGVVNHSLGTGRSAAHPLPQVFGKTGTSQWREGRNIAWFAGYVGSNHPRIAIVAMVQGRKGETLSGGKHAGPLVGEWVRSVYGDPDRYRVRNTSPTPMDYLPEIPVPPAGTAPQLWTGPLTRYEPAESARPRPPEPNRRRILIPRGRWYRSTPP